MKNAIVSMKRFVVCLAMVALSAVPAFAQQAPKESFLEKMIGSAQPKMVKVFGAGAGRVDSFATGFVVSDDGKILTAQGVLLDGKRVRVVTADGTSHDATILRRDRVRQVALLKIQAKTPEYFKLSEKSIGEKGDWVVALSNAFKVADKLEPLSATLWVISLRTELDSSNSTVAQTIARRP